MFLREGSQQRMGVAAVIICASVGMAMGIAVGMPAATAVWAADRAIETPTVSESAGIPLPREVLPWRRGIEQQAIAALDNARHALRSGQTVAAEHQLRDLMRRFPRTHAAVLALDVLAGMGAGMSTGPAAQAAGRSPSGLGVPARPSEFDAVIVAPPVAGWQTTVRSGPEDLREALIDAAGDRVFFDDGLSRLSARAVAILAKQAAWLDAHGDVDVSISGHADDTGTAQSNLRLSHDRALAVRRELIRQGVSRRRLHVLSHGNAKPIAICARQTCALQNRRVVTEIRTPRYAEARR